MRAPDMHANVTYGVPVFYVFSYTSYCILILLAWTILVININDNRKLSKKSMHPSIVASLSIAPSPFATAVLKASTTNTSTIMYSIMMNITGESCLACDYTATYITMHVLETELSKQV